MNLIQSPTFIFFFSTNNVSIYNRSFKSINLNHRSVRKSFLQNNKGQPNENQTLKLKYDQTKKIYRNAFTMKTKFINFVMKPNTNFSFMDTFIWLI